jgi:hemimethylated DNA binding protein
MSSPPLARTLYRALLRWSRHHVDVPLTLRLSELAELSPALPEDLVADGAAPPRAAPVVSRLSRLAFRSDATLPSNSPAAAAALDRAFAALRLLNSHYAAIAADMRATRADRADRTGVAFEVGQVVHHIKFGYRGTIYGWDRVCERGDAWAAEMGVDPQQRFYYVLPDERDCQRLFGGVRLSKYVAEENLTALEDTEVVHRALASYFRGYSPALGRYVPVSRLQYEYPSIYEAEGLRPVDSNLLAHPEEEGEAGEESSEGSEGAAGRASPLRERAT